MFQIKLYTADRLSVALFWLSNMQTMAIKNVFSLTVY